jgi:3-isopropylmalate/(R)-2-methylmalate dehydratase small subunit
MTIKRAPVITGRVIKVGDHIDTDLIYPGKYLSLLDPSEIAKHALEGLGEDYPSRIKPGDVIVAGRNFGCGSSREQAVTSLKFAGVRSVVAASFSRIFFRNAVNQGVPIIECPAVYDAVVDGDTIIIDLAGGQLTVREREFSFKPLPPFLLEIIRAGGLIPQAKEILSRC